MNTIIHYQYRDGANNKRQDRIILRGMCSQAQAAGLRASCMMEDDNHYFVPSAVGLTNLCGQDGWDDEIDHAFHTIESIEMTGDDATDLRTMGDLVEAFRLRNWQDDADSVEALET